jgi:hypothetical protein
MIISIVPYKELNRVWVESERSKYLIDKFCNRGFPKIGKVSGTVYFL